jgi:hypothetical protein
VEHFVGCPWFIPFTHRRYDLLVETLARTLEALRQAGDRAGFARLTNALADDVPLQALGYCLPEARRQILEQLGQGLKIRPCFGEEGCSVTVQDLDGMDRLIDLGPDLGEGIVRLVVLPGLGREHLHLLLNALPLDGLRALRIEGNNIRCREAEVSYGDDNVIQLRILGDDRILTAINALPALEELRLCENRLRRAGARALSLTPLIRLNLRNNDIGDAGAAALSDSPAEVLELERNGIGPVGAELLALGGATVLDLSRNPIGDDGARLLARGNFEGLRLDDCGIGDSGAEALCGLSSARALSLRRNPISPAMAARLHECFEDVKTGG